MSPERRDRILLATVLAAAAVVSLRGIGDNSLGFPDADRILMDGVFIRDFFLSFDWFHPFEAASRYFAQYPALSIGYRVPGYPILIAAVQLFLGVGVWSARLVQIALWLVALTMWFRLVRREWGDAVAVSSGLILATTPFLARWAWFTMTELPVVAWSLMAVATWHRYLETNRPRLAIVTCLLIAAAVWTKQTAVVLLLWFLLEALLRRRWELIKRREIWVCLGLGFVVLLPIAAMTLFMDDLVVSQTVGIGRSRSDPRTELAHYLFSPKHLITRHLTIPVSILAFVGIGLSVYRRDRKTLYFAVGIVAVYAFFTSLVAQHARYTLLWIAPFTLFAALALTAIFKRKGLPRWVFPAVLTLLTGWQIVQAYRSPANNASGFDEVARYVLDHSDSPVVMYEGYSNGRFTYFMRALDPERSMWVLRGDKVLSSTALLETWGASEVFAETEEDIEEILRRFGVQYLVVESRNITKLEIHELFRNFMQTGPFELELEVPVEGTRRYVVDQSLLVYRYLDSGPAQVQEITIPVPLVGRTIVAPWPSER